MTNNQREIRRKLCILQLAEKIGSVSKTCHWIKVRPLSGQDLTLRMPCWIGGF